MIIQTKGEFFLLFWCTLLLFIFSCQNNYKSQGFTVKLLDNSYATPATKPLTQYSQMGPVKKKPFKFQLADAPCRSQTQLQHQRVLENLNPPKTIQKLPEPEENFHYQSIKVIDSKKQTHSPPLSYTCASTSNSLGGGFKRTFQEPTKDRIKNFLSNFKKEEKKKLDTAAHAVSSSQPVDSRWNRFMGDIENYEATPSCSKWDEYLARENDEDSFIYQSPPMKRKSPNFFKFDSPPPQNQTPTTCNFFELGLSKERPVYSGRTYRASPRSPEEHFAFTQEANPYVNFVDPPQSPQFIRQPYFAPASQNYVPQEKRVFNQALMPHDQYFSQPAMHYLPPPSRFAPPRQCTHCNCCQGGGYYNGPPERVPYMPYSQLQHCEPDEEPYVEHF